MCVARHAQITQINKFAIIASLLQVRNILRKKCVIKLTFCKQVFVAWKFPTNWYYDFWWEWSRIPTKVPKNSQLTISLQHLQIEVRDESDFLHQVNHQRFLQDDAIIIDGHDQAFL